jgi:hypothetical protein
LGFSWVAGETITRAAIGLNLSVEKRALKWESFASSGNSSSILFSSLAIWDCSPN